MRNSLICAAMFLLLFSFSGCARLSSIFYPQITPEEKKEIEDNIVPYSTNNLYEEHLLSLGDYINSHVDYTKIFQPKPIANTVNGDELPLNLTNMVITSLNRLSGKRFLVAPYDPVFVSNDAQTGGKGSRVLPDVIISGSITEFDKNIDASERDLDLDLLVGGGYSETDTGISFNGTKKMSRITIDLCLINYDTQVVLPGACVSNTINVLEIEKNRDFGFAIYGSGMGFGGRIRHSQGFHRAIRNLVDYSILQLIGKYYNIPYWKILGVDKSDSEVLQSIKKSFSTKSYRTQVLLIQKKLNEFDWDDIDQNSTNSVEIKKLFEDGELGAKTKDLIKVFLNKYSPETPIYDLTEVYVKLIENSISPIKSQIEQPDISKENITNTQKFYESMDRVDKVYQKPAIE